MNLLYGQLINAGQAMDLTTSAIEGQELASNNYALFEQNVELSNISSAIQNAANQGLYSIAAWIRYMDNYKLLGFNGYTLEGGVVRESLAPEKQKTWGLLSDRVTISWGTAK